jgi:osmotically-inducible protein OsmY
MPEDRKQTHAVEEALAKDERTAQLGSVHVKAVGPAIFIDGEVESQEQRGIVEEIVKKVKGVAMVRNRLQINPQGQAGGWREPHRHEE